MHVIRKPATVLILALLSLIVGCRPSQQTRRNNAANARGGGALAAGKQMDSLYMVQNKLLTIIDTMSNIVAQDRSRIRDLELEVSKLRSLLEQQRISGAGIPPPTPAQNYTAPPPPSSSMQPLAPQSQPPQQSQPASYPPNDKYSEALKSFNDGKYMDALTAFDGLSRSDPSSPYAPNFLYWKGESLYALGQYDEAIRTFHDVLNKYPTSSKADDSEFKIGAAYEKLGDRTNARSAYERLVLSFPESEYKVRAEARLNKLK
ncbi:MAG: tol-pal system protein YbgF [Candidatus Kapaibacterium sp.]